MLCLTRCREDHRFRDVASASGLAAGDRDIAVAKWMRPPEAVTSPQVAGSVAALRSSASTVAPCAASSAAQDRPMPRGAGNNCNFRTQRDLSLEGGRSISSSWSTTPSRGSPARYRSRDCHLILQPSCLPCPATYRIYAASALVAIRQCLKQIRNPH